MVTNRCMDFTELAEGWSQCVLPEYHEEEKHKPDEDYFISSETLIVLQKVAEEESLFHLVLEEFYEAHSSLVS